VAVDRVLYPPVRNRTKNPANLILTIAATVAILVALGSLAAAGFAWFTKNVNWLYAVIPLWIIGPPVWFWFDYFFVYRKYGDPEAFDSYKHGQQISLAIWAALAVLLLSVANAEHFKIPKPPQPVTLSCAPATGAARTLELE
jgi:hypothetical protein